MDRVRRFPTIKQLRAFEATIRLGSLVEAADELNVTPSALSQNISQLEDTLSIQLIDRSGRGMKPTPAGEHLYPHVFGWLFDMSAVFQRTKSNAIYASGDMR